MKHRLITASLLAFALAMGAGTTTQAAEDPPQVTEEGLVLVENSAWGLVYVRPNIDLSTYDSVMMTETFVSFRENWRRDQNRRSAGIRVTANDMETIKRRLASEFDTVFREVLEADDGWPVVDEPGETVLLLRPAIVNLDVFAPDTGRAGRSRTYADQAGEMTIFLEIRDSVTGALLAKGLDRQADRRDAFMTWQSRVQNTAAARRILTSWATSLREALDRAHDNDGSPVPSEED